MLNMADQVDPGEVAASAVRAGLFQDIVSAMGKVLRAQNFSPRDTEALKKCVSLLRVAAQSEIVLKPTAENALSESSATLAVIRAARPDEKGSADFRRLKDAVQDILQGDRSDGTLRNAEALRDLFLAANKASLDASIRGDYERQSSQLPIPSPASSNS